MAFFSGQDINTLRLEGQDTNCFVSLIVDTRGTYKAAITRNISEKSEIIKKNISRSYEFFGDGTVSMELKNPKTSSIEDDTEIEYFMLDVERHETDYQYTPRDEQFSFLDERFDAIEKKKAEIPVIRLKDTSSKKQFNKELYFDFYKDYEDEDILGEYKPSSYKVDAAIKKILTCSLSVNPGYFNIGNWIPFNMDILYERIFGKAEDEDLPRKFKDWADFIIEYILFNFESHYDVTIQEEQLGIIAFEIASKLEPYLDNPYIQYYYDNLTMFFPYE